MWKYLTALLLIGAIIYPFPYTTKIVYGATVTYFGSTSNIADNATLLATSDNVTPPASMLAGDLVYVVMQGRSASGVNNSVLVDGGQTWTEHVDYAVLPSTFAVFTATFNGTWSADPEFQRSGAANNMTIVMHVFRPSEAGTWAEDTETSATAQASSANPIYPGVTPSVAPSVTVGNVYATGGRTFATMTGSGWNFAGGNQYRNAGGSDSTISSAYHIQDATTNPTGDGSATMTVAGAYVNYTVSMNFTPSGGGGGGTSYSTDVLIFGDL